MNIFVRKALPWSVVALVLGIGSGFAFGEAGDRAPVEKAAPVDDGSPSSNGLPQATEPPDTVGVDLECRTAARLDQKSFTAVVGVEDAGARRLAEVAGVRVETRTFKELNGSAGQRAFREQALEIAQQGPIILVLQLSNGPFQKDLAHSVTSASPESVVVVVDKDTDGAPDVSTLEPFPARSVVVPPAVAGSEPFAKQWATDVHIVVSGNASCRGG